MVVMIVSMAAMALALCHPRRCHCASTEFVEVTRFDAQMRMVTTPTRLSVVCYAPLWDMSLALYDILFAHAGVAAARIPSCRPLMRQRLRDGQDQESSRICFLTRHQQEDGHTDMHTLRQILTGVALLTASEPTDQCIDARWRLLLSAPCR